MVKIFKGSPSKGTKTELYYEVIIERPRNMKDLNYLCDKTDGATAHLDLNNNYMATKISSNNVCHE